MEAKKSRKHSPQQPQRHIPMLPPLYQLVYELRPFQSIILTLPPSLTSTKKAVELKIIHVGLGIPQFEKIKQAQHFNY